MDKNTIKDRIRGSLIGGAIVMHWDILWSLSIPSVISNVGMAEMVLHDSIPINGGWKKTTAMVRL